MNEREATDLLDKLGSQVTVGPPPVKRVLEDGKRGLSRRRRLLTTSAVAAVSLVIAAAALVRPGTSVEGPTTGGPTGGHVRTISPTVEPGQASSVRTWVASLPQGGPPAVPYLVGDTFHDGAASWSTRGEPYRVLDKVPGGYLVEGNPDREYAWRYGIRDGSGGVSWLGAAPEFDPLAVLSTDHSQLAVVAGSLIHLFDLEQRTELASIDAGGYVEPIQLVDAGLLYAVYSGTGNGQAHLWKPAANGGAPVDLQYIPASVSDDLTRALVPDSNIRCWRAVDVSGTQVTSTLYKSCGLQRTYTISPDGAHALTVDMKVVNLNSGTASAFADAPTDGPTMPDAVWEDSEHVLLRLELRPAPSGLDREAVTVRCSVVTSDCERVPETSGPGLTALDFTRTP
jgi:hypothetical protein